MKRVWLAVALMPILVSSAAAEYVIGAGDVLDIAVWQHPDLNQQVTVREDGAITVPPLGDVEAAGLSTEALGQQLSEELVAFTRRTTQVTVSVAQFNSRYVIVNGYVLQPGRYVFQEIPSLARVIGLAGGASAGATLSAVQIVRQDGGRETTMTVDLASFLAGNAQVQMPELEPADVIIVPGSPTGMDASQPGVATPGPATISVLGAVNRPGTYPVAQSFSLPEVLGLAGGTTVDAHLSKIKVLSREPDGSEFVATLDLNEIFHAGEPVHFPIRPGDAILIERRPLTWVSRIASTAFTLSRTILDWVLIFEVLDRNNNSSGGN